MRIITLAILVLLSACGPNTSVAQEMVCVIGDSISAPNVPTNSAPWPVVLQNDHPELTVVNASVAGSTFHSAVYTGEPSLGGYTQLQYCINARPVKVVVMLGGNDSGLTGLTYPGITAIQQDVQTLFTTLANQLPGVTGYFILEQPSGPNQLYPGRYLLNLQVIPYLWSDSNPLDYVTASTQTGFGNLYAINQYLISLGIAWAWLSYYEIYTVYPPSSDGIHPTDAMVAEMAREVYNVVAP